MNMTVDFLAEIEPRLAVVERNLHDGDATGRIDMWSRTAPLTLFGAGMNAVGWDEAHAVFESLGDQFANCTAYENEIVAAEAAGDMAYIVALEHSTCSINGGDPRAYVLRATTIFRREGGEWKVVHRHGSPITAESAAAVGALTPVGGADDGS